MCIALQIDVATQTAQWFVDDVPTGNATDIGTRQLTWASGGPFGVGMHLSSAYSFRYDLDMFAYITDVVDPATLVQCK